MKQIKIKYCLGLSAVCVALFLGGCISIPNSPTPRFYALSIVDEGQISKKINIAPGMLIGIGPVKIPEYEDRPQMVTVDKEKMLQFAQFDRWGESLDLGLARLIREDLTTMLPGAKLTLYPWDPSIAVKYQVNIEVVQLDSELDRDMFFVVQWTVIDVQNSKTVIIKRSEFRQPIIPQNYSGLSQTLSTACALLSSQIAGSLALLKIK
jgi:uncharacterized protein